MTKISSKIAYPIKSPVKQDYFVGTDSENSLKTVNFDFEDTAALIGRLNGNAVVNFQFSTAPDIDVDVLTDGKFLTNDNVASVIEINKLYVNRNTYSGEDVQKLMEFIKDNAGDFCIKIRHEDGLNDAFYLNIASVDEFPAYFIFNVAVFKYNPAIPALNNFGVYFFDFELKAGNGQVATFPDGVVKAIAPVVDDGVAHVNAFDFAWNLGNAQRTNPISYDFPISVAPEGFTRFDILVGDVAGNITLVQGIADDINAVKPSVPAGQIELSFIEINGSDVMPPVVSPVGVYKEIAESSATIYTGSSSPVINILSGKSSRLVVKGTVPEVRRISKPSASAFYDGQEFILENKTSGPLNVKHNASYISTTFSYFFYNGQDFTAKQGQSLRFSANTSQHVLEYVGIVPDVTKEYVDDGLDLKLDISAYNQHFKGKYISLSALQTAHPTANDGDYGIVDSGSGVNAQQYIWDTDENWVLGGSDLSASTTDELAEGSTNLYFTEARANAVKESRIPVSDANYSVLDTKDHLIAFTSLTSDRSLFLPAATAANQRIRVVDESFTCASTRRILIIANGSDTISGGINSVINFPGGSAYFESNGAGKWTTLSTTAIQLSAGVNTLPTITDNGNGTITIGNNGVYTLFANSDGSGRPKSYSINGGTFTMVDNSLNFIIVKYDSTTSTASMFASTVESDANSLSSVRVLGVYRQGFGLLVRDYDRLGLALSNKLQKNAEQTNNFRVNNGTVLLGESATRIVTVSAGTAWVGGNEIPLAAVSSSTANTMFFVTQTAPGVWDTTTFAPGGQYNNTQYNPASGGLSTLGNGRYGVIFVFRGLGQGNKLAYVLGQGNYTLGEAQTAKRPTNLPLIISTQMLPVGRIIIQKNASTATQIDKISDESYAFAGVTDHNALTNLETAQAGVTYGHITDTAQTIAGTKTFSGDIIKSNGSAVNTQAGITYTFTLLDATTMWRAIPFTNSNPVTATIPTNAVTAIPVGGIIECVVQGTGAVTVGGAGITLVGRNFTFNTGDTFKLKKIDTDTWSVDGIYLPLGIVTNIQSGTSYTVQQSDIGKKIVCTNAATVTVTIPSGLSSDFNCEVEQDGTGQVVIVGSGTTLRYSSFEQPTTVERYACIGIDRLTGVTEEYKLYAQLTSI